MYATDDLALRTEVMRKAELCATALFEAKRLSCAAMFGVLYAQIAARIVDMLDELDEALLLLDHTVDRATFECVAALHARYENLEFQRDQVGVGAAFAQYRLG